MRRAEVVPEFVCGNQAVDGSTMRSLCQAGAEPAVDLDRHVVIIGFDEVQFKRCCMDGFENQQTKKEKYPLKGPHIIVTPLISPSL